MNEESSDKSALVPRLRFPEFLGAGEWEKKSLADVCLKITNGKANAEDHEDDGVYPLYDRSEVVKKSSEYVFDDEAVIIPGEGMRFQPKYYKGKFNLHQRAYALMQHQGNAEFVYYTLDRFKDTLAKNAVKSTVLSLRLPIIERFSLAVPDNSEQKKIADCLSSLDELIVAETQKLDALKTHKKGLMQQLFPHEGETEPVCRFSTEGDWTVASLPDVVFFQEGPGIMAVDFCSEGVPLVRLAGVAGPAVTLDGCNYLEPEKVAQKWAHFRLELDDLIISTSATFGLSSIVTEVASGAVFYTGLIRFRPSNERLSLGYLKTFLSSPCFARQAESAAVGGGIKHFGPTHLKQMEIPVPPLAEQQRISGCFTSLDDLITSQSQKIDALKTHKKGLMQQLFPVLDEVPA